MHLDGNDKSSFELLANKLKELASAGKLPEDGGLDALVEAVERDLAVVKRFATELTVGKLDGELPSRKNILAAPLKSLHSQLTALGFDLRQLAEGKIVNKHEPSGDLNNSFNSLVDYVALLSQSQCDIISESGISMPQNSWKYHHFLMSLDLLSIVVIETDSERNIVYVNRFAKELLGNLRTLPAPTDKAGKLLLHLSEMSDPRNGFPVAYELFDDKSGQWYKVTSDSFTLPGGQRFFLHMADNINDWKTTETKLRISATMDAMTGVLNHKAGVDELARLLAEAKAGTDAKHCLTFIDIDGLKNINDTYGHQEGDNAIISVVRIISSCVRKCDIVCRYGGDEFLIIITDIKTGELERIYKNMDKRLEELNKSSGRPYKISFSRGGICFDGSAGSAGEILERADCEMYEHKRKKKQPPSCRINTGE